MFLGLCFVMVSRDNHLYADRSHEALLGAVQQRFRVAQCFLRNDSLPWWVPNAQLLFQCARVAQYADSSEVSAGFPAPWYPRIPFGHACVPQPGLLLLILLTRFPNTRGTSKGTARLWVGLWAVLCADSKFCSAAHLTDPRLGSLSLEKNLSPFSYRGCILSQCLMKGGRGLRFGHARGWGCQTLCLGRKKKSRRAASRVSGSWLS